MKKSLYVSLVITILFILPAGAQEPISETRNNQNIADDYPELLESNFQFTFMFPPLSTNWVHNSKTVNKVSLNLFAGNSGAANGFELGSFINTVNHYVVGFQGAGFGNVVGGSVDGFQIAGFTNIIDGDTRKFQGAGFLNITGGSMTGVQGAGFMNLTGKEVTGFQGAGFINIAESFTLGAQVAGFTNIAGSGSVHTQLSGFGNFAEEINGAQLAGFLNIADKVKGTQIGFINICDSIDGVPIGFVSVVKKNGYRRFEFSVSETQYFNFSYRMGIRKFHTIYSIGKPVGPGNRWLLGIGAGSQRDIKENLSITMEAMVHQEYWFAVGNTGSLIHIDRLNLLNQVRVFFGFQPNEKVELFFGPTLNVAVAETSPDLGYRPWHEIGPNWAFYNRTSGNAGKTNVKMWFGITGGVRL